MTNSKSTQPGEAQNLIDRTHWIFDMDGTLTLAVHDFDAIRKTLGLPAGQPILEAIAQLPEKDAQAVHQQLDELEFQIAAAATQQPGAIDLLDNLKVRGCTLGILTRNGHEIAKATLKAAQLDHYFTEEAIVSRDCCAPKPAPDGVDLLMQRWQVKPEKVVMTGDYLFDLQAGHEANTTTVHMDVTGAFSWPELTDVCVTSLVELNQLLNSPMT